jgi:hypothetical protein
MRARKPAPVRLSEARKTCGWYQYTRRSKPLAIASRHHDQPVPRTGGSSVEFNSCGGADGQWVTQWYDGVSNQRSATAVSVSSGSASGINASMVAITITSVGPDSSSTAGGTSVTIAGTGFTGATAVDFGTTKVAKPLVEADNLILVTSPEHKAGKVQITVVTPSGKSKGWPFLYTS